MNLIHGICCYYTLSKVNGELSSDVDIEVSESSCLSVSENLGDSIWLDIVLSVSSSPPMAVPLDLCCLLKAALFLRAIADIWPEVLEAWACFELRFDSLLLERRAFTVFEHSIRLWDWCHSSKHVTEVPGIQLTHRGTWQVLHFVPVFLVYVFESLHKAHCTLVYVLPVFISITSSVLWEIVKLSYNLILFKSEFVLNFLLLDRRIGSTLLLFKWSRRRSMFLSWSTMDGLGAVR